MDVPVRMPNALGERVGRDHAAMDRIGEGNHSDRTALQARVDLLFTGRKEAVEIDVQALRLERFPHEPYYGEYKANIQAAMQAR